MKQGFILRVVPPFTGVEARKPSSQWSPEPSPFCKTVHCLFLGFPTRCRGFPWFGHTYCELAKGVVPSNIWARNLLPPPSITSYNNATRRYKRHRLSNRSLSPVYPAATNASISKQSCSRRSKMSALPSLIRILFSARNFHVCLSQLSVAKWLHVANGRDKMLPLVPSSSLSASSEWRRIFPVRCFCDVPNLMMRSICSMPCVV